MEILDHGLGIPEKEIPHLGEPFYRGENVAHLSGTGLGLSISKRFIELHDGEIWVESEKGRGTTFFFTTAVELTELNLV